MQPSLSTTPSAGIPVGLRTKKPTADDLATILGPDPIEAAGVVLVGPQSRALFLRYGPKHQQAGKWAFPGGALEDGESAPDAALREVKEETGHDLAMSDMPVVSRNDKHGADYSTFLRRVNDEFEPELSDEHDAWEWRRLDDPPQPLHPGVEELLAQDEAAFVESKHPRAPDGKFGSGGGGKSAAPSKEGRAHGAKLPDGLSVKAGKSTDVRPARAGERPADANAHEVQIVDRDGKPQYRIEVTEEKNSKLPDGTTLWGVGYVENITQEHHGLAPALYQEAAKLAEKNGGALVGGMNTNAHSRKVLDGMVASGQAEEIDYKGSKLVRIFAPTESAGGTGGGTENTPRARGIAAKLEKHAETFRKHAAAAQEFVKDKTAGEVLAAVAQHEGVREKAKEALSVSLQSLLNHVSGLDASTWKLTEELVDHTVHHFADLAAITTVQAKAVMRKGIEALIAQRSAMKSGKTATQGHDEEDGVTSALQAMLDLLGDDEHQAPENVSATDSALALALDRDSVRIKDEDGRLNVAVVNLSKACVNPYRGREIPDYENLRLDPDRIYQLLRDPEELAKAASTFNGIQLLRKHVPVSAEDHQPWDVVGTTGTHAVFEDPYLKNSLHVWPKDAIDDIETGVKKELSSGYHYKADMTPGNFRGTRYDGVMRNIRGNHVALVENGRAGPDVVVGDSNEAIKMTNKEIAAKIAAISARAASISALVPYFKPRLAMDAKIDMAKVFDGITGKNFKAKRAEVATRIKDQAKGKLAQDASVDDVEKLLDLLADNEAVEATDETVSEAQHRAMEVAARGNSDLGIPKAVGKEFVSKDELRDYLKTKNMADDDIEELTGRIPGLRREEDAGENRNRIEREGKEAAAEGRGLQEKKMGDDKDTITKPAMDAAIQAAVQAAGKETADRIRKEEREIRKALAAIKPHIGEPAESLAFDSAEAVYRHCLVALGVDGAETLPAAALQAVLSMRKVPRAGDNRDPIAMDTGGGSVKSLAEMVPAAARITSV